jgi:hypothetical protein
MGDEEPDLSVLVPQIGDFDGSRKRILFRKKGFSESEPDAQLFMLMAFDSYESIQCRVEGVGSFPTGGVQPGKAAINPDARADCPTR